MSGFVDPILSVLVDPVVSALVDPAVSTFVDLIVSILVGSPDYCSTRSDDFPLYFRV